MPEGVLSAVAAEHVPALPYQRDQQRHDQKIEHDVRSCEQRHRREDGDDDGNVREGARSCPLSE